MLLLIASRRFGVTQLSVLVETREELPVLCFECRPNGQALQKSQAQWHARLAVVCQSVSTLQQVEVG